MSGNPRMVRPYQPHQVPSVTPTAPPSVDWRATRNRDLFAKPGAPLRGESWWTAHATPSAPRTDDFYAEVAARHARRLDTSIVQRVKPSAATVDAPPVERVCDVCGERFTLKPKGPSARRCSAKCNQRAWKARRKSATEVCRDR